MRGAAGRRRQAFAAVRSMDNRMATPLAQEPAAGRSNAMAWWSAGTILISAFLLFQVQPIISKKILPWFGGSPAVWTTCVLFFQLALLGGYAYSHWLIKHVGIRRQGIIHASLLVLALLTLPLFPPWDMWKPADGNYPALRIMRLLLVVVGATYFLLSTTGPLVQAWFARLYPGRSPYRLYALSNVGSLAALLTYPFLFETTLMVNTQGYLWGLGFVVFAGLIGIMALTMWREAQLDTPVQETVQPAAAKPANKPAKPGDKPEAPPGDAAPSLGLWIGWLALAATATMTFLSFTNHLSQDIAVVPFMWVIPLSIYLLTFILCFEYERWYSRKLFGVLALLSILWLAATLNYGEVDRVMEMPQQAFKGKTIGFRYRALRLETELPITFSELNNGMFDSIGKLVNGIDSVAQAMFKRPSRVQPNNQNQPDSELESAQKDADWISFECSCGEFTDHVVAISTSFMIVLFLICMVCHGELVKSKPSPKNLTSFYLSISVGGALGGLWVAIICPLIFKSHFELAMSMIGGFAIAWIALLNDGRQSWLKSHALLERTVAYLTSRRLEWLKGLELRQWLFAFLAVGTTLLVAKGNIEATEPQRLLKFFERLGLKVVSDTIVAWKLVPTPDEDIVARDRNFYGTVSVAKMGDWDVPSESGYALYNGRIWHGFQYQDPARHLEPTTYYVTGTGAALSVQEHPKRKAGQGLKVGVIGLGTGSMAAHAEEGDKFYFYDIDPKIVAFARKYFTYLDKSPGKPEVILGDARIMMERQEPQNYDVIVLDAFSGDAIPAHLLTKEAFALYDRHLHKDAQGRPDGVIVIHISNRYLDLKPVVKAIANEYQYDTVMVHASGDGSIADTASDWVLVSKNQEFLASSAVQSVGEELKPDKLVLWTDQFTALFPIMD
jgi:hypothetical protein